MSIVFAKPEAAFVKTCVKSLGKVAYTNPSGLCVVTSLGIET